MTEHPDLTSPGPRATGRGAWLLEARELVRLAVPLAATQLAQMAILATDTVMLGHYSKEALAAGALGNAVYFLLWLLGSGRTLAAWCLGLACIPLAVSPLLAEYLDRADVIGELLWRQQAIRAENALPGRLAPNTALSPNCNLVTKLQ